MRNAQYYAPPCFNEEGILAGVSVSDISRLYYRVSSFSNTHLRVRASRSDLPKSRVTDQLSN